MPSVASLILGLSLTSKFAATTQGNTSSEAGEAAIPDATTECTYYSYEPVRSNIYNFPPIWQPATLLANDSVGQAQWAKILPSIPTTIPVKGTIGGDFSSFTPTYSPSDPDCWWTYDKCDTPKLPSLKPDITSTPEPLSLGYGFDDGPNCSHNAFYDYLSSQNQKATMFYIGSNVMNWPLQAQRALADGHEICVHTWSHNHMTAFPSANAFAELWYTMQAIKLVIGVTPTCWRPPYGDVDDRIRAIAAGLNLTTIVWQYDSNDWEVGAVGSNVTSAQVDANYQDLVTSAGNGTFNTAGAIMLMHEVNNYTMQEAINWYPRLKAAFKSIVPVGVGMNWTQPYVETNYSLPAFSQYTAGQVIATATASGISASKPSSSTSGSSSSGVGSATLTALRAAAVVLFVVLSI
ncbi:hypothetical protein HWV62_24584 [Athelia sp. TMB]|nr:hypothetical protein HWV62_24584 [Athelia sp. TMB]